MNLSKNSERYEIERQTSKIPTLSDYAKSLESHVRLRYLRKISVVVVDPATFNCDLLDPECLPPIEQSDLFSYLVLQTSYYTREQ